MANLTNKQVALTKGLVFVLALLPFARLVWAAIAEQLGANPVEFITRNTGDWVLYFLCMTLAITPLRRLSGWNSLIKFRRMLGLYAFFYAFLHFMTFLWFDHFFDLDEMWKDVLKRPFITVGFTAFVLLMPLALTSTNGMIRRIGGKNWQRLHQLVYLIIVLGLLHYFWMKAGKHDFALPLRFTALVIVLFGARIWWKIKGWQQARLQRG